MRYRFFLLSGTFIIFFYTCPRAQAPSSAKSKKADSLFFTGSWQPASSEYEKLLNDAPESNTNPLLLNRLGFCYQNVNDYNKAIEFYKKAITNNPGSAVLKQTIYSRLAKSYAAVKDNQNSMDALDKAVQAGYINFEDMDSAKEYGSMRNSEKFKEIRDKAYSGAYPCMANPHAGEFDFWVGEWNAYSTGTKILQGHSIIQRVSGGCLILENWTSAGGPYNGKSMNFIDSTGKWQQVWVGAGETTGPNIFINGEYKDAAMRFVFTTKDQNGNKLDGKFTFFNQGPDQVRQLQETSADNGKTWTTVYDFTYVRIK